MSLTRALARKLAPKQAQKVADAVSRAYNSRSTTSMGVGEVGDLIKQLGGGDFKRGMRELRGMDPKQFKHLKF